uniref:C2 NT-type domain-containing protein n=1 Tax=Ananas comosus var. bracteatus TaxID=296719 RepID=A0A6V7QNB9_ANACO|nr:unnamed protein product [Ananas comosus var. bracteatus]
MNGLRLSVTVRKKEKAKEGAVQTMPSRVMQGIADYDETLFIRCNLYYSGGRGTGKPLKFEGRPFVISVVAVDAPELGFGKRTIDLSAMILESVEKSLEGQRLRQWERTFELSGKAKGAELVLRLGFQIMEDGHLGIYNQAYVIKSKDHGRSSSFSIARNQSKSTYSAPSPSITRSDSPITDPERKLKGVDYFNHNDRGISSLNPWSIQKSEQERVVEDFDIPEFEVIEKGIEIQGQSKVEEVQSESTEGTSASNGNVKEIVRDSAHLVRLKELDSIAKEIEALESMIIGNNADPIISLQRSQEQQLDAKEERMTREYLRMLKMQDNKQLKQELLSPKSAGDGEKDGEVKVLLPDLGKGLGSVICTRDGGFLISTNPFNIEVARKESPKLAMHISRPFVFKNQKLVSGFEVFQRLAAMGSEELSSKLLSLVDMDELTGKSAEKIAFEGIASAIISGRNKEVGSSSATRTILIAKQMAAAMSEEILGFSLQKMEAMAVEALKIQAEMAEEEAPFDVSPLILKDNPKCFLDSTISLEEWAKNCSKNSAITMSVVIQLRDPLRSYEAVGGPMIAVVQAMKANTNEEDGFQFKVENLHIGRLTAMQWLVAYNLAKAKKNKLAEAKPKQDFV